MNAETIEVHIRATYCGKPFNIESDWAPTIRFDDPLVSVEGRGAVAKMFRRLGRWMSATEVVRCDLIEQRGAETVWALEVHYARSARAKKVKLASRLTVTTGDDGFLSWIEAWESPVRADGNPRGRWRRTLRWGLGRISTL